MSEDAQPNDLRRRSAPAITVHSARFNPKSLDYRSSFKRPSDCSYTTPPKRRRLEEKKRIVSERREIIRELPPTCRKGVPGCNRERKQFIAREIELLNSQPGLEVLTHTLVADVRFVRFLCKQVDILNCSLAPSSRPLYLNHGMGQKAPNQPKVELGSSSSPGPTMSVAHGPPRIFKSGTLSFKPAVPITGEAFEQEKVGLPRQLDTLTDLDHLVPVAELLFGKQGPPKPTKALSPVAEAGSTSRLVNRPFVPSPTPDIRLPSPSSPVNDQIAGQMPSPESSPSTIDLTPSPNDIEASFLNGNYTCEPDGNEFRIPIRQQHDKLRRFLSGPSPSSSVVVSMYGALERVDVSARKHWLLTQGPSPTKEAVEEACLVIDGNRSFTVLGHGRDHLQLSLVSTNDIDAVSVMDLKRPWNSAKKGGVTAVAPMLQPLTFASGGYDHCVHLWTVQDDLSSASSTALNIRHNSHVQSLLAIRDTSSKLVSAGADCSVHIWDLSSERVVSTIKTSNSVYHAHPTTSPFCTLLEVAHRELQFEVRDHRCVPSVAVQRFGYTTLQVHGRFMKGASLSNCFASGDRAGNVRLWDLRSVKTPRAQMECFDGQKIAHLVFQSSRLLACSENNQIRLVQYDQSLH